MHFRGFRGFGIRGFENMPSFVAHKSIIVVKKMLSRLRIRPVTVRAAGKRFMSGDVESARVEHHRWYQITLGKSIIIIVFVMNKLLMKNIVY